MDSMRLAVRICQDVAVYVGKENDILLADAEELAGRIAFNRKVEFLSELPDSTQFDSILSIGTKAHPDLGR
jgi:hypothetical protein